MFGFKKQASNILKKEVLRNNIFIPVFRGKWGGIFKSAVLPYFPLESITYNRTLAEHCPLKKNFPCKSITYNPQTPRFSPFFPISFRTLPNIAFTFTHFSPLLTPLPLVFLVPPPLTQVYPRIPPLHPVLPSLIIPQQYKTRVTLI